MNLKQRCNISLMSPSFGDDTCREGFKKCVTAIAKEYCGSIVCNWVILVMSFQV
jgi:hypothetical protein